MSIGPIRFEEGVFAGALALPAAERSGFVLRACHGDPDLSARLEALLRAHELKDGALDAAPQGASPELGRALQARAPAISG